MHHYLYSVQFMLEIADITNSDVDITNFIRNM